MKFLIVQYIQPSIIFSTRVLLALSAGMTSLLTRKILHIGMTALSMAIQWLELLIFVWNSVFPSVLS